MDERELPRILIIYAECIDYELVRTGSYEFRMMLLRECV